MDGTLDEVLISIANSWGFDADELIEYAQEDELGGHTPHPEPEDAHPTPKDHRGWNKGIWEVEGKVLYALIRALKPRKVLEIGNQWFCSTSHIAEALLKNEQGHLWTIDLVKSKGLNVKYKDVVTQIGIDLFRFDYGEIAPIDFIFEDSFHTPGMVHYVWGKFQEYGADEGMIVSHDSEHKTVGEQVQAGLDMVGLPHTSYKIEPSDCGLAMWRKS